MPTPWLKHSHSVHLWYCRDIVAALHLQELDQLAKAGLAKRRYSTIVEVDGMLISCSIAYGPSLPQLPTEKVSGLLLVRQNCIQRSLEASWECPVIVPLHVAVSVVCKCIGRHGDTYISQLTKEIQVARDWRPMWKPSSGAGLKTLNQINIKCFSPVNYLRRDSIRIACEVLHSMVTVLAASSLPHNAHSSVSLMQPFSQQDPISSTQRIELVCVHVNLVMF